MEITGRENELLAEGGNLDSTRDCLCDLEEAT